MAVSFASHQPRFRTFLGRDRMPDAIDIETAMGAGADPGIFLAAPIDEIVPAFGAATGVVRDFIGVEAILAADVLRHVVERARQRLVRRLELACRMQTEK